MIQGIGRTDLVVAFALFGRGVVGIHIGPRMVRALLRRRGQRKRQRPRLADGQRTDRLLGVARVPRLGGAGLRNPHPHQPAIAGNIALVAHGHRRRESAARRGRRRIQHQGIDREIGLHPGRRRAERVGRAHLVVAFALLGRGIVGIHERPRVVRARLGRRNQRKRQRPRLADGQRSRRLLGVARVPRLGVAGFRHPHPHHPRVAGNVALVQHGHRRREGSARRGRRRIEDNGRHDEVRLFPACRSAPNHGARRAPSCAQHRDPFHA